MHKALELNPDYEPARFTCEEITAVLSASAKHVSTGAVPRIEGGAGPGKQTPVKAVSDAARRLSN
jgi:hypothetical protein